MTIKPLVLGITGGIGSGKSMVCRLLSVMGISVYIADTETHRLMLTDPDIRSGLTALLGEKVYEGGVLNKPLIAAYLFASPHHAARINAIVHPTVRAHFRQWVAAQSVPVVAMESAILFESGFDTEVDRIVMVYAPSALRLQRTMQRDDASREAVESRMHSQMDDEEKRRMAHFTIVNDGTSALIPQLTALLRRL